MAIVDFETHYSGNRLQSRLEKEEKSLGQRHQV